MASIIYPIGKNYMAIGEPAASKALFCASYKTNLKALLLWEGGAYNPAHQYVSSVISGGLEMTGGSYARKTVSNVSVTVSGAYVYLTCDPITFSALPAGHTAVACVFYFNVGGVDANSFVFGYYDGGSYPNALPLATTGGDLVVTPNAQDGFLKY